MRISKIKDYAFQKTAKIANGDYSMKKNPGWSWFLLGALLWGAISNSGTVQNDELKITIDIHKTPTCGCCKLWSAHLEDNGIIVKNHDHDPFALDRMKEKIGIEKNLASCHTGISENGYFFEGHIPAKFILKFLMDPPEGSMGLAVPGMPMGSPGMEMGDMFDPYSIILVNKDGTTEVYANIETMQDQH